MGLFTNMAVGAISIDSHPTIDRKSCANLRPHKEQCTLCKDICPRQLFARPNVVPDFTGCIDCGLCVSVCPARCIAPSGEQVKKDIKPLELDSKTIWIGCERSSRQNDVVEACVSSLSWETLANLSLHKKLVLDFTPCAECDNEVCLNLVRKSLHRLLDFLGEPMFKARISLANEPDDYPYVAKAYDRRAMMQEMTHMSKKGTAILLQQLPGMQDEEAGHATDQRLLLHQRTRELKEVMQNPPRYGWYLPKINDKCYGCGRCEKSCRVGALKQTKGEDGFTRFVITPWKCSECGQCVKTCSEKAIEGLVLRQLSTLGPVSVHKMTVIECPQCGKPVRPTCESGLCVVCDSRKRVAERRAEMERKRKEREAKKAAEKAAAEAAAQAEAAQAEQSAVPAEAAAAVLPAEQAAEVQAAAVENSTAAENTAAEPAESTEK